MAGEILAIDTNGRQVTQETVAGSGSTIVPVVHLDSDSAVNLTGALQTVDLVSAVSTITNAVQVKPETGVALSHFVQVAAAAVVADVVVTGSIYVVRVIVGVSVACFVRLYDKASAPGTGDDPICSGYCAAGTTTFELERRPVENGIGIRATAGGAKNDNTAITGTVSATAVYYSQ